MDKNSGAFTDYFVICSGSNPRQIQAISDEVELSLKRSGVYPNNIEGFKQAEWILLDYVDFVVARFFGIGADLLRSGALVADSEEAGPRRSDFETSQTRSREEGRAQAGINSENVLTAEVAKFAEKSCAPAA